LGDLKSFQARFIALRHKIVLDGKLQNIPFHDKDLSTLLERVECEGTSFVKVTLPLLGKALDHGLVTGQFICPANFRVKRNTSLPILCHQVFLGIFDLDGSILKNPDPKFIFFLRQFLLLDAKLIVESTPDQDRLAVQGFKDRQSLLRKKKIPVDHPVLIRAKTLMTRVLSRLDLSDITPRHGPGNVAERIDRFERWDISYWPAKAEREYPFLKYGTQSFYSQLHRGRGIPLVKTMDTRCCLVPKDFKGPRLISAEGTVNQYLQQGQMLSIMRYVDSHPLLSRSIKLRDQSFNQKAAQEAYERGLVTLDLSNASDTVSTTLVWYLLSGVPRLRRQLMSTRSDFMVYDQKDRTKIVAFAPMGSATCFPVETLVFWSLSLASIILSRQQAAQLARGSESSWSAFLAECSSCLSVFGDDIIVPAEAFSILSGTLDTVGCSVNESKTCYRTPFRESCGTEWIFGSDVTIIRNRRYHYEDSRNVKNYPVLLELQRKFFLRGLFNTAEQLCIWAREIYPVAQLSIKRFPIRSTVLGNNSDLDERSFLFSSGYGARGLRAAAILCSRFGGYDYICYQADQSSSYFERQSAAFDSYPTALGWEDAIDIALPVRYNESYQRLEFRVPISYQAVKNWTSEGYPRLFARLSDDSTDRIAIRNPRVKMAWSYLPLLISLSRDDRG